MGVVCAEDANQTVTDTLQLNDTQDVISDASEMSYDDLSKKINSRLIGFISLLFGIMFMFILCFSLHCIFTILYCGNNKDGIWMVGLFFYRKRIYYLFKQ